MKNDLSFRPSNLEEMWSSWLTPLRYREPALIVSYPGSDFDRRLAQLKDDLPLVRSMLRTKQHVNWIELDYRQHEWESADNFVKSVEKEARSDRVNILLLRGFGCAMKDQRSDMVIALRELYRRDNYRVMLATENNYYDPANEAFVLSLPTFEPRIVTLPLYDLAHARSFVQYLADKWEIVLNKDIIDRIVAEVGGNLGLLKQVVWYLRDHGVERLDAALSSEQLLWQVRSLWQGMSASDREYLRTLVYGLPTRNVSPLVGVYLSNIGLVDERAVITIAILREYIRTSEPNPRAMTIDGDQLLINQQDYASYFTQTQKLIMCELLQNPGSIVTRERIMELIWGVDGAGSEWALDSHINRLREKLKVLGIGEKHLVTKRGKGLTWLT